MNNKELLKKYPFLQPRSVFTGKKIKHCDFTLLDSLPIGWRKSFGIEMCEDLRQAIAESKPVDFYIYGMKEKYGSLRIECLGCTDKISDVIDKYENISITSCIKCGQKGKIYCNRGWFEPLCPACAKD